MKLSSDGPNSSFDIYMYMYLPWTSIEEDSFLFGCEYNYMYIRKEISYTSLEIMIINLDSNIQTVHANQPAECVCPN